MAEVMWAVLPNRRPTTSGIVKAITPRSLGAKKIIGIRPIEAAITYHTAEIPQEPKARLTRPLVEPPPMLFAARLQATMIIGTARPANM